MTMRIFRVMLARHIGQERITEGVMLTPSTATRLALRLGRVGQGFRRETIPVFHAPTPLLTHASLRSLANGRVVLDATRETDARGILVVLTAHTPWTIEAHGSGVREIGSGSRFASNRGGRRERFGVAERLVWLQPGAWIVCSASPTRTIYHLRCQPQATTPQTCRLLLEVKPATPKRKDQRHARIPLFSSSLTRQSKRPSHPDHCHGPRRVRRRWPGRSRRWPSRDDGRPLHRGKRTATDDHR